jgi:hypothetical protein
MELRASLGLESRPHLHARIPGAGLSTLEPQRTQPDRVRGLPGPEVAAIGERAKRFYGCYISFGCYARRKAWPDHVINMSVIVGPDGNIVSKQWKARNISGLFGDGALIGTTIYDVLDRYVEMYGRGCDHARGAHRHRQHFEPLRSATSRRSTPASASKAPKSSCFGDWRQ